MHIDHEIEWTIIECIVDIDIHVFDIASLCEVCLTELLIEEEVLSDSSSTICEFVLAIDTFFVVVLLIRSETGNDVSTAFL